MFFFQMLRENSCYWYDFFSRTITCNIQSFFSWCVLLLIAFNVFFRYWYEFFPPRVKKERGKFRFKGNRTSNRMQERENKNLLWHLKEMKYFRNIYVLGFCNKMMIWFRIKDGSRTNKLNCDKILGNDYLLIIF